MKRTAWVIILFFAIAISVYTIAHYLTPGDIRSGLINEKIREMGALSFIWYVFLYIHIIFSLVALITGPFLFAVKLRHARISLHKFLGKMYLLCILFGGLSGFYLSFHATGGIISKFGFGAMSVLWMISGYVAYRQIKQKNVVVHREWMIRNYSLTFAAVTLRIWLPLSLALFGSENFSEVYRIIAWLCWVPNILVAEWYIHRSDKPVPQMM
jgi:hypothetical protein